MAGLFTADIENRGLVLDPRTKLFVMITLVIFALGGTGSELSAAALTRGLGTKVRRTNICKIGFHVQDIAVLMMTAALYILWILGLSGVIV